MLALESHNFTKGVQPKNGRLSTMPGKMDHRFGASLDVLDNVLFQNDIGHAERFPLWIEVFFFQIVAVFTTQVADGTNRLDKDLKIAGSFDHFQFPKSGTCANFPKSVTCPVDFCKEYRRTRLMGQGRSEMEEICEHNKDEMSTIQKN